MKARRRLISTLIVAAAMFAGGCATAPHDAYARYGDPPPLRLELVLEGLAQVALFGLYVWAGHHHHGIHWGHDHGGWHSNHGDRR